VISSCSFQNNNSLVSFDNSLTLTLSTRKVENHDHRHPSRSVIHFSRWPGPCDNIESDCGEDHCDKDDDDGVDNPPTIWDEE
jgi:hypothetical protein